MSPARQHRTKFSIAATIVMMALLSACAWAPPQPEVGRYPDPVGRSDAAPAAKAAAIALQQVGVPYRYGGRSPGGFDCSGLVFFAYQAVGKRLPRTTGQLWSELPPVSRQDLRIGDVLFFKVGGKMSHVGMYLGEDRFVHAPSTGRTVSVASLNSPFYDAALLRAGRP
jgi:cell wall-associated NlpC family hydrolase